MQSPLSDFRWQAPGSISRSVRPCALFLQARTPFCLVLPPPPLSLPERLSISSSARFPAHFSFYPIIAPLRLPFFPFQITLSPVTSRGPPSLPPRINGINLRSQTCKSRLCDTCQILILLLCHSLFFASTLLDPQLPAGAGSGAVCLSPCLVAADSPSNRHHKTPTHAPGSPSLTCPAYLTLRAGALDHVIIFIIGGAVDSPARRWRVCALSQRQDQMRLRKRQSSVQELRQGNARVLLTVRVHEPRRPSCHAGPSHPAVARVSPRRETQWWRRFQ